jgi:hypothetical protein
VKLPKSVSALARQVTQPQQKNDILRQGQRFFDEFLRMMKRRIADD